MDVSLDEIIKKNRISSVRNRRRGRGGAVSSSNDKKKEKTGGVRRRLGRGKGVGQSSVTASRGGGRVGVGSVASAVVNTGGASPAKKKKVSDLRLLIGGKARPVRDARDKINKSPRIPDAREKLLSRSSATVSSRLTLSPADLLLRRGRRKLESLSTKRRLETRKPAYMDLEEARLKRRSSGSLLYRTVDNDRGYQMESHGYPPMQHQVGGGSSLLQTVAGGGGSILRGGGASGIPSLLQATSDLSSWHQPSVQDITRFQSLTRTFNQDDVWAQPQLPRRSAANGVKRRLDREEEVSHTHGYRIVVSNLQPTVTHEDIKELFEDIGSLYSSRVVRPGTAEVVYKNMEDAVKAVDTYHNRQLDGQPMKCLLVKPSNMSRILSKGSVVPDLHAIHKALFNK